MFLPIVKNTWWLDEQATAACAERLSGCPALANALIELHGDLGAGKTAWVRHLLGHLGVSGRVKSPTYGLVETHLASLSGKPLTVWHFDFYRFDAPREWEDAGLRDAFTQVGLKLVEWPEKAGAQRPPADLAVHIECNAIEQRHVRVVALNTTGQSMLGAF